MSRNAFAGLSILIGFAMLLTGMAALPFVWKASVEDQVAEASALLNLIETKLQSAQRAKKAVMANADAVFVAGATTGLASAALQGLVAGMAEESGMALDKMEARPAESRDGATVLRLDVAATGSIEALRSYVHMIETRVPLIFVTEAHIAPDKAPAEAPDWLPSEKLVVSLQLEALTAAAATP